MFYNIFSFREVCIVWDIFAAIFIFRNYDLIQVEGIIKALSNTHPRIFEFGIISIKLMTRRACHQQVEMLFCLVSILKNRVEQSRILGRGKRHIYFLSEVPPPMSFFFLALCFLTFAFSDPFLIACILACTHGFSRDPLPSFPHTIEHPQIQSTLIPPGPLLVLEYVETYGSSASVKYSTTLASVQITVGYFLTALHSKEETSARIRKP